MYSKYFLHLPILVFNQEYRDLTLVEKEGSMQIGTKIRDHSYFIDRAIMV